MQLKAKLKQRTHVFVFVIFKKVHFSIVSDKTKPKERISIFHSECTFIRNVPTNNLILNMQIVWGMLILKWESNSIFEKVALQLKYTDTTFNIDKLSSFSYIHHVTKGSFKCKKCVFIKPFFVGLLNLYFWNELRFENKMRD